MNVLSLCDGMSCGLLALKQCGIKVDRYFSAEIKPLALRFQKQFDITPIGDVNKIHYHDGILSWENGSIETTIDLVMFGSPCQTFSIAIPADKRTGLANLEKSGLFYQCKRILDEVKPRFFLMENVYSMRKSDVETVTNVMGVKPIMIDGADYTAAIRKRWYWTNIPFTKSKVDAPYLKDITSMYTDRQKARCLAVIDSRPNTTPVKMFHRYYSTGFTTLLFKSKGHYDDCVAEYLRQTGGKRKANTSSLCGTTVFDGVRYMNTEERCKCQGVDPSLFEGFTENEAADLLGDGWCVPVIADILKGM